MSRLILFSGGVESTAMLTRATKNDIVMTIRDTSPRAYITFHQNRVEEIAKLMHVKIHYTDIKIPIEREKDFVYQLWTFVPIAILWASRIPRITEVWYGLNNQEPSDMARKDFEKCVQVFKVAYPNVALKFPLRHLTKKQQWDIIPSNVQPLITSCLFNKFCGTCHKCLELKELRKAINVQN